MLYDSNGTPLDRYTTQRRLLGLLAILAIAGDGGLTRDKLVGLLWPDYSPERARHSLTQALYAARKASGEEELFVVSENIRLNSSSIACDVVEFQYAVRGGDLLNAVDLYRGPFLDGFYLQSGEFEDWLQHERQRLEDLAVFAYTRVIEAFEQEEDYSRAVEHARRLAAIRPTDATIAQRLMRLLAAAGDRAAAIAHAHTYSTIVRERHGIEPDAAVLRVAQEIRDAQPEPRANNRPDEPAEVQTDRDIANEPSTAAAAAVGARQWIRRRPRHWGWILAVSIPTVVAAVILLLLVRNRHHPNGGSPAHRLIVAPFRVTAADARLHYLAEGMVELLSARLADNTTDQSMDAAAVLRVWRKAQVSGTRVMPTDSILGVGRALGVERVIIGSVVGTPERVILDASLVASKTGAIVSHAVIEGSTDTLTTLVDALARRLLLKQIAAEDELSDRTTLSLPALRAYLRGSAAFGQRDYMISFREYKHALDLDSTFGLAALKLGLVAARIGEFDEQHMALDQAWRARSELAERDRSIVVAFLGPNYPALSTIRQSVAAWNRAARLAPEIPEVWYGLAAATFNSMLQGFGGEEDAVVASLDRAIRLDSTFVPALTLLANVQGRSFQLAAPKIATGGPATLRAFAITSQATGLMLPQSQRALDLLESRTVNATEAMNLLLAEHSAHLLAGQGSEALEVTRRMQRVSPATHAHLRLRVLDALYAAADSSAASVSARQLSVETTAGVDAPANACVLAQWYLARADFAGARSMLALLRQEPYTTVIAGVPPGPCIALMQAGLAVAEKRRQAKQEMARLDSLDFTSLAAGDAAAYAPLAKARWYLMLNDSTAAATAIAGHRVPLYLWPRYKAAAASLAQQIRSRAGQRRIGASDLDFTVGGASVSRSSQ